MERMSGCVTHWIGFRFDNAPTQPPAVNVMDQDLANQIARELHGVHRKLRPA